MSSAKYDIKIEQGASFQIQVYINSETIDVTQDSFYAQIRKTYSDPTILKSFNIATGSDDQGQFIQVFLTSTETSELEVDEARSAFVKDTIRCWDLFCVASSSTIKLLMGEVTVVPQVTKF